MRLAWLSGFHPSQGKHDADPWRKRVLIEEAIRRWCEGKCTATFAK